jgi:hypothetical protein
MRCRFESLVSLIAVVLVVSGCASETADPEPTLSTTSHLDGPIDVGEVPPDCLGSFEREPNDASPVAFLGDMVCGLASPDDIDKFDFDVHVRNGFSVRVQADADVSLTLDGPCVRRQVISGTSAVLRAVPTKSCTIHVTVTSSTRQFYRLYKNK